MDVCQPISSLPSSSAFTFPMKMQLQNRQQQQQQVQRQQKQKLQQQQQQQQLQLQLQLQQQQQAQQAQDAFSLSPDSLYGYSLDEYTNFTNNSYGTDFSADSPLSLGSPVSPTTANPFALSAATDDFDAWNKIESPDADEFSFIKPEPGNSPLLFATTFPTLGRDLSVSPAINPLQLSNSSVADDLGLSAQQQQKQEEDEEEQEASVSPSPSASDAAMKSITMPARDRRYAVRKSSSTSRNSTSAAASSSLKRKSSSAASSQSRSPRSPSSPAATQQKQTASSSQPPKKTAHNLIEKRYRTNLNDKILALRDSVPSLRVVARRNDSTGGSEDEDNDNNDNMLTAFAPETGVDGEDLGGLTPAHKLNKATILSKATEYIAHLERRNEALARENTNLRGKVDGYEMLVMSRGGQNGVWC